MIRKAVLLTVLAALLAMAGLAGTAAAAPDRARRAADPLVLGQITPAIARSPSAPITIAGTFTGTSASVHVRLHYSPGRPFRLRSEMAAFLADRGYVTTRYSTKIHFAAVQSGRLPFQLSVTPQELGMSQFGVYPLAIEVLDANSGQRIAIKRTFLTYAPEDAEIPRIGLAVALPLTERPHRADDATFMDDELRASITSGRLAGLLKVAGTAAGKQATWFVDPAVLDDVHAVSAGRYTVKTADGGRRMPADQAASRWLADLRTALADATVFALPYADPDLTALIHNGLEAPAVAAIQRGGAVATELLGKQVPTSILWPAGGRLDRDTLDELAVSGVRTVLLDGDTLPERQAAGQETATPGTAAATPREHPEPAVRIDTVADEQVTALLADPVLSGILTDDVSGTGDAALLARQRFLAETALLASQRQEQSRSPAAGAGTRAAGRGGTRAAGRATEVQLIAAPRKRPWTPNPTALSGLLNAAAEAPWLRMVPLTEAGTGDAPTARTDLVYGDQDRGAELGRSYLGTVRRLSQQADAVATITKEHTPLFNAAILRITSVAWRGDRKRTRFAKQLDAAIANRLGKVTVIDTPRTMAGTDGQVPVSVANNLDKDITVKIRVTSKDASRLAIDVPGGVFETDLITVLPGRTQLVNVPVTVPGGGGDATIGIQLLTAEGKRYGKEVHVTVHATDYTGIALAIVGAGSAIMLAALVLRLIRRRRRPPAAGEQPGRAPGPAPQTPSAEPAGPSAEPAGEAASDRSAEPGPAERSPRPEPARPSGPSQASGRSQPSGPPEPAARAQEPAVPADRPPE